jgi:hypothetical protein
MSLPESELIRREYVLRDLQFLSDVKLARRSLVRWLALSLGLISPNESRTLILDVLDALFCFHFKRIEPDMVQIIEEVDKMRGAKTGEKAIRYHVGQLKKSGIIESRKRHYRFVPSPQQEDYDLVAGLEYAYSQNAKEAFEKIRKAAKSLERSY